MRPRKFPTGGWLLGLIKSTRETEKLSPENRRAAGGELILMTCAAQRETFFQKIFFQKTMEEVQTSDEGRMAKNVASYLELFQEDTWPRLRHTADRTSMWWMQVSKNFEHEILSSSYEPKNEQLLNILHWFIS